MLLGEKRITEIARDGVFLQVKFIFMLFLENKFPEIALERGSPK